MVDFLGIGSRFCGTSWLHHNLERHPEVYMPIKEHHFWDLKQCSLEEYLSKFRDKGDRKAGDITPSYEQLATKTIEWIKRLNPKIKVVYIIRNPIDKAWSGCFRAIQTYYPQKKKIGNSRDWYYQFLTRQLDRKVCDYKSRIENWKVVFGWDQFLLLLHDFIEERPNDTLRRILRHIGVADIDRFEDVDVSNYIPSYTKSGGRAWTTKTLPQFFLENIEMRDDPNRTPPLPEFLKPFMQDLYKEPIEELSRYLKLDLSYWLAK